MRAEDYAVRPLSRDNLVDLVPLTRAVFGRRTDEEALLRKYDTSHLGGSYFGYLAYDEEGRPVAFQGAVPMRMEHAGELVLAAQSGDTMTLREHRGRGLFPRLGRLTDDLLAESGIRFIWGMPNQASESGFVGKLGWQGAGRMRCFDLATGAPAVERLAPTPGLRALFRRFVRGRLAAFRAATARVANSAAGDGAVVTHRDAEFFAYKLRSDSLVIEMEGCRVWVKVGRALLIGDIEPVDEARVLAVLRRLRRFARAHGIPGVVFETSAGTGLERIFSSCAKGFDTWLVGGKSFDGTVPLDRLRATFGDVDIF